MGLVLVRHGQASFASDDYDRLSDTGREQSHRLGDWMGRHGRRFTTVVHGGMRRHIGTLDAICARIGAPLPTGTIDRRLAEFDHQAVFGAYLAAAPMHPGAIALRDRQLDQRAAILDFLHAALSHWRRDELDHAGESWQSFRSRCREAARDLAACAAEGAEVLVITSAGVIAQIAAAALDLPDERCVELNLGLRNSAFCELEPVASSLRLSSWNSLPHLAEARELWTFL